MVAKTKPNSYTPWNCVILAVDPGRKSGVAIYRAGELVKSGTNLDRPTSYWCRMASTETTGADYDEIPLIVVIESHVIHGKWGAKAFAGLAESTGVWKEYVGRLEGLKWKPKILRVPVSEWRRVYGKGSFPRARAYEDNVRYWKDRAKTAAGCEDHDEAEAILIGRYATRWWKVGEQRGVKEVGCGDQ